MESSEFDDFFYDSVLMLAWCDLEDQPNSTSWHYAQRFANGVPVLLLNRNCINDFSLTVERTEFQNIDIVHIPDLTSGKMVEDLKILLSTRGLSRPMIWISDFQDCLSLIHCFPNAFKIFHPLKNPLTMPSEIAEPEMEIFGGNETALIEVLKEVDLYVASNFHEFESLKEKYGYKDESLFDKEKILISDSFDEVVEKISNLYLEMRSSKETFNVLVLFDEERIEDQNINNFFLSIKKYSKNRIYVMPRSISDISKSSIFRGDPNIDVFDAIIFYCSMKNYPKDHFSNRFVKSLSKYHGVKILFLKDESEAPEKARELIEVLNFDLVYTAAQLEGIEFVYPQYRFPTTEFARTYNFFYPSESKTVGDMTFVDGNHLKKYEIKEFIDGLDNLLYKKIFRIKKLTPQQIRRAISNKASAKIIFERIINRILKRIYKTRGYLLRVSKKFGPRVLLRGILKILKNLKINRNRQGLVYKFVRLLWRLTPQRMRQKILKILR